jgi:hypothetical protein
MKIFNSCIFFPGDITGLMIPKMMQQIFENKTGIEPPSPYMIYLTNEGHLLIGFKKDEMKKPLILLDDLIEAFTINKRMGIIE